MVYKQTIRLELAQACFVRAMDIAKKLGIEEAKLSTLIQNYAGLCQDHGLFKEAERYYERAASIRKQTQGQNSQEYVIALANWASLYAQQGNLTKAISLYEQALRYWPESLKQSRYYANTLCNLSSFYAELGEKWKAEQLAAQALGICEKYHLLDIELWMACQEAIASALELRDSPKEAFEVRKKTLARSGAEYADRNPYAPSLHTKLAQYYTKMGFYATADSLLSLAQKGILRMYGRDHLLSCQTQLELAELRLFMGKASEALPLCEQAALFLQKNYPRQYWLLARLQGLKAEALFQLKNYELALEAIEQALLFTKKGAEQVYASLTEQERMLYEEQNAQPYLLKAYQYLAAMGKADRLLSLSLSNKGDLLHEAREIQEQLSLSKDQSTKDKLQELVDLKQRIGNAHGLSKYDLKSRGLNLDSLEHRATLLEKELNQHPALQSKLQNNKSYDWAKLKAALKEKEAAVEILCFYVDRKTGKVQDTLALGKPWFDRVKSADSICYIALLVRPNAKLPELIFLKDGQFLNGQALAYYTNCIQMRIKDKKSYEWFWAPLEGKLQGVEKLYISAEGVYHQVNPATFYNEAQKKYLGEYLSIEPLSSLRELLQKRPLVQAKDAILLGRPSFSTEGSQQDTLKGNSTRSATRFASMVQSGLSDLPATEKEVKQIDSLLKTKALQSKVLLFAQATEDTLKQLRSPSVLHVATHGFFISEQHQGPSKNPMLSSGILLSGVLDFYQGKRELSENDGVLTAFEAMHISLQHTNLVVLSACETGLGHQQIGEGVYGLQRAFKVAGARYVLMSLWKVDDAVTQQLMVLFYTHWLSGMEISAAFHKAQAEIRALYPQPYFWGAFVLLG